ncbi:uncharacterized protein FSUBG_2769 [Fusarium subglutinans]|uniref:Uncharacterized protein n=1 Tax=Gibberella subglutinans TaxID=42677 RepID=A0A8H5Q9Z5_GIBSU|nr:uncharacterized protein FSUBG_2769 [Fusarium subglutinans]KAF5610783.1 hypothetical protein FSUBG_2769 [Fusarium subglutinans]
MEYDLTLDSHLAFSKTPMASTLSINPGERYCRWREADDQIFCTNKRFASPSTLRNHYWRVHETDLEHRMQGNNKGMTQNDLLRQACWRVPAAAAKTLVAQPHGRRTQYQSIENGSNKRLNKLKSFAINTNAYAKNAHEVFNKNTVVLHLCGLVQRSQWLSASAFIAMARGTMPLNVPRRSQRTISSGARAQGSPKNYKIP